MVAVKAMFGIVFSIPNFSTILYTVICIVQFFSTMCSFGQLQVILGEPWQLMTAACASKIWPATAALHRCELSFRRSKCTKFGDIPLD